MYTPSDSMPQHPNHLHLVSEQALTRDDEHRATPSKMALLGPPPGRATDRGSYGPFVAETERLPGYGSTVEGPLAVHMSSGLPVKAGPPRWPRSFLFVVLRCVKAVTSRRSPVIDGAMCRTWLIFRVLLMYAIGAQGVEHIKLEYRV